MCEYIKENKCSLQNTVCPFVYWCSKINNYKNTRYMNDCKIKKRANVPHEYYEVCFSRHGDLYINVKNQTIVIKNIYDDVPNYVKLRKSKGKYTIVGKM